MGKRRRPLVRETDAKCSLGENRFRSAESMATLIHAGAHVDPEAQLGADVVVMPGAVVTKWARIGDRVMIHPGAVIGGEPQYLGFDAMTPTYVDVGADSVIRESATVNRSMYEGKSTSLGERCFFMAGSHAGHDCTVAHDVVLANNAMLAGHVDVGAFSFIGGGAGIHQFCRIGAVAMVAGLARITKDVPVYCMVAERDELTGLNLVGLKRRSWSREVMMEIKRAYHDVMGELGNPRPRAATLLEEEHSDSVRVFLEFFAGGKRGFAQPVRREAGGRK